MKTKQLFIDYGNQPISNIFARKTANGKYRILYTKTKEPVCRIYAEFGHTGSFLHPEGILLTKAMVERLGIQGE